MKKLLLISLAAIALLSCNKFEQVEAIKVDSETSLSVPIEAENVLSSEETKAYLEDNGSSWSYLWEDGDAIEYYQLRRGQIVNQGQAIVDKRPGTTNVVYPASDFRVGDAIYSYIGAAAMDNSNPRQMYLEIPDTQISSWDPETFVYSEDFSFTIGNVSVAKLKSYDVNGTQNAVGITPKSGKVEFKINGFKRGTEYACSGNASNLQIDVYGNAKCDISFAPFTGAAGGTSYSVTSTAEIYVQGHPEQKATIQVTAKATVTKEKKMGSRVMTPGKVTISYTKGNTTGLSLLLEHEITGDVKPYYVRDCMPCVSRQYSITSQVLAYPTEIANNITFHMLGSAVQWKVYTLDEAIGAGEVLCGVLFDADKPCAGTGEYNIVAGSLELENLTSSSIMAYDEEELIIPYKDSDNDYVSLYMVLAPGTYSADVAFVTDQHVYVYHMTDQTFSRAIKKSMSVNLASSTATVYTVDEYFAEDPDEPVEPDPFYYYELVTEEPASWDGTYLIVNSDDTKAFNPVEGKTGNAVDVLVEDGIIISDGIVDQYAITVTDAGEVHPASPEGLEEYDFQNVGGQYMMWSQGQLFLEDTIQHSNSSGTYTYHHTLKYDNGVQVMSAQINASTTNCYYMTYGSSVFSYVKDASANRVHLYKYVYGVPGEYSEDPGTDDPGTDNPGTEEPGTEEPDPEDPVIDDPEPQQPTLTEVNQGSFELVNSYMRSFISDAETQYTDANRKTVSLVTEANRTKYGFGGNGDLYQSGTNVKANDKPLPVTLTLDSALNGSNVSVAVYNDSAKTSYETTVSGTVSNSKFEIFNLIPGRTYYYTVTKNSEDVAIGYFQTTGTRRIIKVSDLVYADNANNCRDLGGLPTTDGKHIKYGKIFRGTNIDGTTAAEQAILTGYLNIGLDVDLRGASSDKTRNIARQKITSIAYDSQKYSGASDLLVGSKVKNTFTAIFDAVASGKACYIHCFAGADRTGYICSLIAALCGVSSKEITIDYELTSFSCVDLRDRSGKVKNEAFAKDYPTLEGYTGSTLKEKAENLLMSYGITRAQITAFQNAMVE